MTTRSQKRKTVAELVSGELRLHQNNQNEIYVAGPSNSPKIQSEKLDEIKTSLRKEIMSDLTKILAENQMEMLNLIAPTIKKPITPQNTENCNSEHEKIQNTTSTPIKTKTTIF